MSNTASKTRARAPQIKVIGLGSPHGDDQAGWQVIRSLEQLDLPDNVELLSLDRPGPALISYLEDTERVILIDACDAGWAAGTVQELSLQTLLDCAELHSGSSHQLGVAETLMLSHTLNTQLPDITLYAIQLEELSPFSPISTTVFKSLLALTQKISHQLMSASG